VPDRVIGLAPDGRADAHCLGSARARAPRECARAHRRVRCRSPEWRVEREHAGARSRARVRPEARRGVGGAARQRRLDGRADPHVHRRALARAARARAVNALLALLAPGLDPERVAAVFFLVLARSAPLAFIAPWLGWKGILLAPRTAIAVGLAVS